MTARVFAISVVAALVGAFAAPAHAEIVLKSSTFLPKGNPANGPFWKLVEAIEKKSKGEIKFRYVGGPEAIPSFKQYDAVRNGVIDINFNVESYYGAQVTGAAYTHLTQFDPVGERKNGAHKLREEVLAKQGIRYVGRGLFGPWFNLFICKKKISSPKEIAGMKIRVSGTYEAFVKALGATPINMPGSDIYTALERGTVDGFGWAMIGVSNFGWHEVCKYILEPRFFNMNAEVIMNGKTWDGLPAHLKAVVDAAQREHEVKWTAALTQVAEKEYKKLQGLGMEVIKFSPPDTKWYLDTAYKAHWDEVIKNAPELGPKLRRLISK